MQKRKNIQGLDGLRGIAILGVTLFHMFPHVFKGGYLGVILFFVLTGFLLVVTNIQKMQNHEFSAIKFYVSRLKRIYPPLLVMVFTTLGLYFFFAKDVLSGKKMEVWSIVGDFNNWWQIWQNMDYFTKISNASPFSHLWFLSIEIQFYLVFPLLLFGLDKLMQKKGKTSTSKILLVITIIFTCIMPVLYLCRVNVTRLYYGTDTRIFSLFAGMLLGFVYKEQKSIKNFWITLGLFSLFLVAYCVFDGQMPIVYLCIMITMTLFSMILIDTCSNSTISFDLPVLSWIGKHSYELYLWQYPVIYLFQYKSWNRNGWMYVIEILILLVLALWTNYFLKLFKYQKIKSQFKKLVLICGIVGLFFQTIGIYALATSKEINTSDLQKRIAQNEKSIKMSRKESKKQVQTEEGKNVDYTPSGNSQKVSDQGLVFLGDSVMLTAYTNIKAIYPDANIDAAVSRQAGQEQDALRWYQSQGMVHNTVVISLGTNGILTDSAVEQTLDMIGPKCSVFWVNVYAPGVEWEESNNNYLNELAKKYSNVSIIDWKSTISQHTDLLEPDGIHPTEAGADAYAHLIQENINGVMKKQIAIENNEN